MYDRYNQAFIKKDFAGILACIRAPFLGFSGELLAIVNSLDAVEAGYRDQRDVLDKRDYDHSEILEKRISPLAADSALLNTTFRRYKRDGSLLEEGAGVYIVSKSDGSWKIRGFMLQDPKYFGKTF